MLQPIPVRLFYLRGPVEDPFPRVSQISHQDPGLVYCGTCPICINSGFPSGSSIKFPFPIPPTNRLFHNMTICFHNKRQSKQLEVL